MLGGSFNFPKIWSDNDLHQQLLVLNGIIAGIIGLKLVYSLIARIGYTPGKPKQTDRGFYHEDEKINTSIQEFDSYKQVSLKQPVDRVDVYIFDCNYCNRSQQLLVQSDKIWYTQFLISVIVFSILFNIGYILFYAFDLAAAGTWHSLFALLLLCLLFFHFFSVMINEILFRNWLVWEESNGHLLI